MRYSNNEFNSKGQLVNGFDYDLQVWVVDGIIQNCGHPASMRPGCCNADSLKGQTWADVEWSCCNCGLTHKNSESDRHECR